MNLTSALDFLRSFRDVRSGTGNLLRQGYSEYSGLYRSSFLTSPRYVRNKREIKSPERQAVNPPSPCSLFPVPST